MVENQDVTMISCFDTAGSHLYGVATQNRTTSTKASCLLNASDYTGKLTLRLSVGSIRHF